MTRHMRTSGLTIAFAILVAACGADPTSSASDPSAGGGAINALDLQYTCGAFPFRPDVLAARPGTDEQANNPAAAALRAHLSSNGPDIDFLPDTGWHLTGMDAHVAEFVTVGGDFGMKSISLENNGGSWKVRGWGDCRPRLQLPQGLGPTEWAFDPEQPKPGPATQVFDALVTEMSCNSGKPADGRFVGPQLIKTAATILVIFAVRPNPLGGAHTCPSNPPTRIPVDLGEPLGVRKLLDGGQFPPDDPAKPQF
jgi:hypothetical protein